MRRRAVLRSAAGLAGFDVADWAAAWAPDISPGGASGSAYSPLASRRLDGSSDCRVSPDGEAVFVAIRDGFAALALPALEPLAEVREVAGDREAGPLSGIQDLGLDDDRLLVPGSAHRQAGRLAGIALYDVADPANPVPVAFHDTTFPVHNAALVDGRAYLTAGTGFVVVDVTDDDPIEVGRWSPVDHDPAWGEVPAALRVLHDVRVRGDLAVLSLWDAGTWLIDVADPAAVEVLGRAGGRPVAELAAVPDDRVRAAAVGRPGNHHSAALSADADLLAIGAEAFDTDLDDGEGGPGGIQLYDIAEPTDPTRLAEIRALRSADETRTGTWTTAHDFAFARDRLVSAWYQGGVRVHRVTDPTKPVELAAWRRQREVAFWTAQPADGDTFVATATSLPDDDLVDGVYLFPNRPGEQPAPPPLTRTPAPSPMTGTGGTGRPSPTLAPGQAGLGPLAALGGIGGALMLAAWRRRRGR